MHRNIILSIADDQRWDTISVIGDRRLCTPHFDSLAERGVVFENARCQNGPDGAVCVPSRAAIHTGRCVSETSMDCEGFQTLGEALRQGGYYTHGIGKWHNQRNSFQRSFAGGESIFFGGMHDHVGLPLHRFDPTGEYNSPEACQKYSSVAFADSAVSFLREYDGGKPYFLYVAWTSPHDPRTPPRDFASLYNPDSLELPPNVMGQHPFDNGELNIRDECLAASPRSPAEIRRHLADYFGMISELDSQFGRVLKAVQDRGDFADTLIVHTSDHGLALGQHGLMGKQNLYEHSVRVPLVLAGPEFEGGAVDRGLCYSFDLTPTLLDWAGVASPSTMTARSLLSSTSKETRRRFVTAFYKDKQRSVTDGVWKLIRYSVNGIQRDQLFKLDSDPWEMNDLAGRSQDVVRRLEAHLPVI